MGQNYPFKVRSLRYWEPSKEPTLTQLEKNPMKAGLKKMGKKWDFSQVELLIRADENA